MKNRFLAFMLAFVIIGCSDEIPAENETATGSDTAIAAKQFFPILDYLRGEVRIVDSSGTAIKRYTVVDGKADSGYIQTDQFKKIVKEFLPAELSKENFEKYYTESSFFDQSTQTSTFTYSTKNDDLEFHRIDVLVQGSASYDKVSSVYMEKFAGDNDSSVIKKVLWKGGESVIINSETVVGNGPPIVRQERLIWNMIE
jgi:hypothetical protein